MGPGDNPKSPPSRVDWISKNPHYPPETVPPFRRDTLPREHYKKTMVWTETNLNKTIMGWIRMVDSPPAADPFEFSGEFVVPTSPLADGSKPASELTRADKLLLLRLFKDEKDNVDAQNLGTGLHPWPTGWALD